MRLNSSGDRTNVEIQAGQNQPIRTLYSNNNILIITKPTRERIPKMQQLNAAAKPYKRTKGEHALSEVRLYGRALHVG